MADFEFDEDSPLEQSSPKTEEGEEKEESVLEVEKEKEVNSFREFSNPFLAFLLLFPILAFLCTSDFPNGDPISLFFAFGFFGFSILFLLGKDFQDIIYLFVFLGNLFSLRDAQEILNAPFRVLLFHFYFQIVFRKVEIRFPVLSFIGMYFGILSLELLFEYFTGIHFFVLTFENLQEIFVFKILDFLGSFFIFFVFFFILLFSFLFSNGSLFLAIVSTLAEKFFIPVFLTLLKNHPELLEKILGIINQNGENPTQNEEVEKRKIVSIPLKSKGEVFLLFDPNMVEGMKKFKILKGEEALKIIPGYRYLFYPRDFGDTITIEFEDGNLLSFVDDELVDTFSLCKN